MPSALLLLAALLQSTAWSAPPALEQLAATAGTSEARVPSVARVVETAAPPGPESKSPAAAVFARCTTVMDGIPVALLLSRESALLELAGTPFADHKLTVLSETSEATRVRMFVAGTTDLVFAEFELPDKSPAKVEIFAKTMGKPWGTFDCSRM